MVRESDRDPRRDLALGVLGFALWGCAGSVAPSGAAAPTMVAAPAPAVQSASAGAVAPAADIASLFEVPTAHRDSMGDFRSPLLFNDGTPVQSAADWPRRREEILATWHGAMGAWPALIRDPIVEIHKTERRDEVVQHQVQAFIAPGDRPVKGYILVPEGAGPFPAVLVVYYEAQSSVGLGDDLRDFALQLAKRGFVTMAIGRPTADIVPDDHRKARGGSYFGPAAAPVTVQPLSMLAYIAANAHTSLARRVDVRADRIGIVGHSFGGKWSLFAGALYDKFACAVWSDPGIVFDERDREKENPSGAVNYWSDNYLGLKLGEVPGEGRTDPYYAIPKQGRVGAYKTLFEGGHDLTEVHALMSPRPFLVSGGSADGQERWPALNHAIAVNRLLGFDARVAMSNRPDHSPTKDSNEQIYRFFEWWLQRN